MERPVDIIGDDWLDCVVTKIKAMDIYRYPSLLFINEL